VPEAQPATINEKVKAFLTLGGPGNADRNLKGHAAFRSAIARSRRNVFWTRCSQVTRTGVHSLHATIATSAAVSAGGQSAEASRTIGRPHLRQRVGIVMAGFIASSPLRSARGGLWMWRYHSRRA